MRQNSDIGVRIKSGKSYESPKTTEVSSVLVDPKFVDLYRKAVRDLNRLGDREIDKVIVDSLRSA